MNFKEVALHIEKLAENHKIILFGAGITGKQIISEITNKNTFKNILGFADNFMGRERVTILGLPVFNPKMIADLRPDYIIICVQDKLDVKEIKEYLFEQNYMDSNVLDLNSLTDKTNELVYLYNPDRKGDYHIEKLKNQSYRFYPSGDQLKAEYLKYPDDKKVNKINKETPIVSMGSCFASEIKSWLKLHKFNYLETADGPGSEDGSARYGRLFSTFSMVQEFERAFGDFNPQETH